MDNKYDNYQDYEEKEKSTKSKLKTHGVMKTIQVTELVKFCVDAVITDYTGKHTSDEIKGIENCCKNMFELTSKLGFLNNIKIPKTGSVKTDDIHGKSNNL